MSQPVKPSVAAAPSRSMARIVSDWRKLRTLRADASALRRQMRTMQARLARIEQRIETAGKVTLVRDGVPIEISTSWSLSVRCPDPSNERCAEIYGNARTPGLWGLKVYHRAWGREGEQFCGAAWGSREVAIEAGIGWVTHAIKPPFNGVGSTE